MDRTLENPGKRVPKVQSVMLISQAKGQRIIMRKYSSYFLFLQSEPIFTLAFLFMKLKCVKSILYFYEVILWVF